MHPSRTMSFDDLYAGLEKSRADGLVIRKNAPDGRAIYVYSQECVYSNGWNDFALMARGLILHPEKREIVATPFPKFFNAGERNGSIPDLPFEVYEKVDGSLAIIHFFDGAWRVATKGSFDSEQAKWAEGHLSGSNLSLLDPTVTYLAEAVYPENRIVVHYTKAELVLLGAYKSTGDEFSMAELVEAGERIGWRVATRHAFESFSDLVEHTKVLPATAEGFVIRFEDGLRLKLKGEEYRRIHGLISRCTPLAMWEAMKAGDDMEAIRRDLPEEFWADFDAIVSNLSLSVESIVGKVREFAETVADQSDKDIGLRISTLDPDVRPFIFQWRKFGNLEGRAREALFRHVRPTGNILAGYTPSYAMNRVVEELAS